MPANNATGAADGRSRASVIFRKELREIFRDRRTVIATIVFPLLIMPGILALQGVLVVRQVKKQQERTYKVGIVGQAAKLSAALAATKGLQVVAVPETAAATQIKERKIDAAVILPADAEATEKSGSAVSIKVLEDAGSEISTSAVRRVEGAFDHIGDRLLAQRLKTLKLPPDFATPYKVEEEAIAQGGSSGLLILSQILPYFLIMSALSGAFYAAIDQVAGEKERGTLETLLVSGASRRDIVLGKFGTVVVACMISSILTIVGFIVPFVSGMKAFAWLTSGTFHLSGVAVGVMVLVLLPLSVLFAGLLLAISTFARNQREAQTYITPLYLLVMVPALLSTTLGVDVARPAALIPILNVSLIIKQALSGSYDWAFIGIAFVASAVYAALALLFATKLFQNEAVLIKA